MSATCIVRRSRAARAETVFRPGAIGLRRTNSQFSKPALWLATARSSFPSNRKIYPRSASQSLTAFSAIVSNTACKSEPELLMTLSTSLVAVCCSRDSERSSVRWRSSLSRRVFSIAMTACAPKFLNQLDLLVGEGTHFRAIDEKGAHQLVVFEHRHRE